MYNCQQSKKYAIVVIVSFFYTVHAMDRQCNDEFIRKEAEKIVVFKEDANWHSYTKYHFRKDGQEGFQLVVYIHKTHDDDRNNNVVKKWGSLHKEHTKSLNYIKVDHKGFDDQDKKFNIILAYRIEGERKKVKIRNFVNSIEQTDDSLGVTYNKEKIDLCTMFTVSKKDIGYTIPAHLEKAIDYIIPTDLEEKWRPQ